MRSLTFSFAICLILHASQPLSTAQTNPGVAACKGLMSFGIYDEFNTTTDKQKFEQAHAFVCESDFGSYGTARAAASSGGFNFLDIFSLSFGDTTAESDWGEWRRQFCQLNFNQVREKFSYMNKIRIISPTLMSVVKACIESNNPGLYTWYEPSQDRTIFKFNVKYRQSGSERAVIEDTTSYNPTGLRNKCTGTARLNVGREVTAATRTVVCSNLDPTQNYTILVHTTQGDSGPILEKVGLLPTANLTVSQTTITKGQPTSLTWSTRDANKVILLASDGRVVHETADATGSITDTPNKTTAYTLHALGLENITSTEPKTVTVNIPPPTATFTSDRQWVALGRPARLSWTTTDAEKVIIDQGIGEKPPQGSVDISPTFKTKYTLTAIGTGPSPVQSVEIDVRPKAIAYEHFHFTGAPNEIFGDRQFASPVFGRVSSIQVFTDEWLAFVAPRVSIGGHRIFTLLVRGPRDLNNLHAMPAPGGGDWGDRIWMVKIVSEAEAAQIRTDPNVTVIQ